MVFDYMGYIEEKDSFTLQNLGFTLFIKKHKVQRNPANRALSMSLTSYHSSLLSKGPSVQMKNPPGLKSERKPFIPKNAGSSTFLKIGSSSYHPQKKMNSSSSLNSYSSMPVNLDNLEESKLNFSVL